MKAVAPRRPTKPGARLVRSFGGQVQPTGGPRDALGGRRELLGSAAAREGDLDDALDTKRLGIAVSTSLLGGRELFAPSFGPSPGVEDPHTGGGDGGAPGSAPGDPGDAPGEGGPPGPDGVGDAF